jgi:hypothetical protein
MPKDTKEITIVERYTTTIEVSESYDLELASDDDLRALLTGYFPVEGKDQVESLLLITDLKTLKQVKFDKDKL